MIDSESPELKMTKISMDYVEALIENSKDPQDWATVFVGALFLLEGAVEKEVGGFGQHSYDWVLEVLRTAIDNRIKNGAWFEPDDELTP